MTGFRLFWISGSEETVWGHTWRHALARHKIPGSRWRLIRLMVGGGAVYHPGRYAPTSTEAALMSLAQMVDREAEGVF